MTYREYYMMLETEDEIMEAVEKDINVAIFLMGNNTNRVELIKNTAQDVLLEKFGA